ncbi:TetR/AcrR family transcriptional regulator [Eubacterium ventriosum]|uniref:TetR/AcrR family transcriptional regulator n=1 Tax=Eubacterium ventriosum TaxID=39496 RepID=UPI0032C171CA
MPPKVKITKDAILKSAFNLTRKYGLDYVTAKSIAKDLHCSTQPIYWVFENMENLRKEIVVESNNLYNIYFHKKHENLHPLKAVGVNYILFAQEEPNLFKLLFMTDREKDISIFKSTLDDNKIEYLSMIKEIYDFNDEQANQYYVSMWIFSHGIATMLVSDLTAFTTEEISKLLTFTATSVIAKLKKGGELYD